MDERELENAIVAFGGRFYKAIRQQIDVRTSDIDVLVLQTEFPILAISVGNALIGLRKQGSRKLMATLTSNIAMFYGIHFEKITNGKVTAESYAGGIAKRLAEGDGMEYSRIICEEPPMCQPQQLIVHFAQRVNTGNSEVALSSMIEPVADALTVLMDDLKKAGI